MDGTYKPPEGYLTMAQTQAKLGVSKATAQKVVREAKLPTYSDPRNKRVRLFKVSDVEQLLQPVLVEEPAAKRARREVRYHPRRALPDPLTATGSEARDCTW
jgi:hypothetical protein